MSGTRRMWSRRILRAGWLIAPIFTLPTKIFGGIRRGFRAVFFDYQGRFETGLTVFFVAIISLISLFVWGMSYKTGQISNPAEPADIKVAMADSCQQEELLKRLRVGMIRPWDINQAEKTCEEFHEQQKQKQMLEQQKEMLGIK